ncbi:MAG: hypothetical protein ACTSVY_15875 [Candidatus Helarchaeota archaeon]
MFVIFIFIIISIIGGLCGAASAILTRKGLKRFRGNLSSKFKSSLLFGFLVILYNVPYWVGSLLATTSVIIKFLASNLGLLVITLPILYGSSYLFTILLSKKYLNESISKIELLAIILLILGITFNVLASSGVGI